MSSSSSHRADTTEALGEIAEQIRAISRENQQLFQRLLDSERRFRGLARSVWQVQEEERRRLARELHDSIGQTLVGLIHQVERLAERIGPEGPRAMADEVDSLARQALDETRELSRLLRPPVLDDLGLEAALAWLARTLQERTGLQAEVVSALDGKRLAGEVETLVFRLVQEAMNNVIKHAPGACAKVDVARKGAALELLISDDGPGFDAVAAAAGAGTEGSGLRGMRDRVELFGGNFELDTAPGAGTRIYIRVPLPRAGAKGDEST